MMEGKVLSVLNRICFRISDRFFLETDEENAVGKELDGHRRVSDVTGYTKSVYLTIR